MSDTPDPDPAEAAPPARDPSRVRTVSVLGLVMIFSWGSSYYLPAIFFAPIGAATGWSPGLLAAGFSAGLLIAGLAAPRVGLLIQRHGGRRVLASGLGLIAAGLVLLASAREPAVYIAGWMVTGLGMGAALYDAAFSALGRLYGTGARGAITALTLFGGFASTVCWPLSAWLLGALGWRGALLAYAAFHCLVTIPLCLRGLPAAETPHPTARAPAADIGPLSRDPRVWLIALTAAVLAMVTTILTATLVPVLTAQGLSLAAAVGLGALFGPAQVAARVIEMAGRGRHHPIWTMAVSVVLVLCGLVALWLGWAAAPAILAYGAGNGLWSIARGALPLAIFGAADYPRIMGRIAPMAMIASAAGPWVAGAVIDRAGPGGTLSLLVGLALLPPVLTLALALLLRGGRGGAA